MNEFFTLQSTYEVILELPTSTRPIRIEVLRSIENKNKFRARIWESTTYNLYPTSANILKDGGIENKMMSCDEIEREITTILSEDANDLFWGKEWESEEQYLSHIKELLFKYQEMLNK